MTDENQSRPPAGDPEPPRSTAPMWIIVTILVLFFVAAYYFDRHSGWFNSSVYSPYTSGAELEAYQPKSGAAAALARGKTVYDTVCGICHGANGEGKPNMAPELAGSEWVQEKGFNRVAHVPLRGLNGPITVGGKDWNLSMAAMGAALSDDDLAAVLTYIRSSWGNKASAVTGDDVKKIRAGMKSTSPINGETELKTISEDLTVAK